MALAPLKLTIEAVDKATAGVRRFSHQIEALEAPVRKVNRSFKLLGEELGFEKVKKAGEKVVERMKGVGEAFKEVGVRAFEVIAGEGGLLLLLKELAGQATEVSHAALKVGMSVEAFQGLRFGAQEAHIEMETLETGLIRLNKATGEAAAKGQTAKVFKGLGISVRDAKGHIKGTDQILDQVADKLSKLHSRAAQTAFVIKLFGRSGMALFPILEQGSAGIRKMREEAEAMGAVLGETLIHQLEEFDVSTRKLWGAMKGFALTAVGGLMPALNEITDELVSWTKANRDLIRTRIAEYAGIAALRIRDFGHWVSETWPKVQKAVEQFGGLARVLRFVGYGFAIWLLAPLAQLVGAFALLGYSVLSFGAVLLATPIGWIVLGLGLIGFAVYEVIHHWDDLKKAATALWDWIVQKWDQGVARIRAIVDAMKAWMPSWITGGPFLGRHPGDRIWGGGSAQESRAGASGTWQAPAAPYAGPMARTDVSGTVRLEIDMVNGTVRRKDRGERSGPLYFLVDPGAGLTMDPAWGN